MLALLAAVLIHAVIYVLCKKRGQKVSVLTYNTLPCLGAGFLLLFLGHFVEMLPDTRLFSVSSLSAVAYLGVITGVYGIMAYFALPIC